jgi:mannan endo-1,4-beta-mannosidase
MVSDIDIIAVWLKALKTANIPVLFRPLHEASGKWFWWGAKGPEPCKALWKLIFNRLTVTHGINNLIWVWTTDAKDDNLDWYPGDEYVDILGVDIYSQNGDFSSQILTFDKIREAFGGKKLVTLSENGVMPDPDNLIADEAGWSWFMTWSGDFVRNPAVNPLSHWQKIMDHQYVLTRDEMPDRSGPTSTFIAPESSEKYGVATDFPHKRLIVTPGDQIREYDIRIYDLYGRMRGFYPNQTGDASVFLNQFTEGIYIVRLESGGSIENYKIAF